MTTPPDTGLRSRPAATAPSERVRLRRKRERGHYERDVIESILDEALIAHLGITGEEGQPFVVPTLHARSGDFVYCHGSLGSRTLKALAAGAPACLTVSLIDGLVLARSAMHHSANYRSVMLLGQARPLSDPQEKRRALEAIVEHIVPGRWTEVREPTDKELAATAVVSFPIEEASAKIRTGGPIDDEPDLELPVWAGVLPLVSAVGEPQPDALLDPAISLPSYLSPYRRPRAE
ncbi:MAG TPA: pyridoxamine 5'-phosphate oxidase family protein [Solirubrobacteraceae bacterium]|nr:pyridoxamine 5'-phosphate oxidase family protein [Solirubrobacteraceae bacterium]